MACSTGCEEDDRLSHVLRRHGLAQRQRRNSFSIDSVRGQVGRHPARRDSVGQDVLVRVAAGQRQQPALGRTVGEVLGVVAPVRRPARDVDD